MIEHITNERYVASVRERVVATARSMLEGTLSFLEGARTLSALRFEAGVREDDSDFMTFVAIDSENDDLPLGVVCKYWSKEALDKLDPEIKEAEEWAKNFASKACESLVRRFHA